MTTVCLSTAYLAPISYYCVLMGAGHVLLEQHEHYTKQTYRNRANISTANGVMPLTIPVEHQAGDKTPIRDLRISDHGNWRHLHWQALQAAYDKSPYFEYYADDFAPFYEGKPSVYLLDYNLKMQELVCNLINLRPNISLTDRYEAQGDFIDLRSAITPKLRAKTPYTITTLATQPAPDPAAHTYYQVFYGRHGFLPDLSVADLLFNMGPESLLVLRNSLRLMQDAGRAPL